MVINKLKLKAFKSFPNKSIEFKPLTLLAGMNNSGKSSIIQSLRMFCNSADGDSILLSGHGPTDEIRSKSSAKNDLIKIVCSYTNNKTAVLEFDDFSSKTPEKAPVCCYVGANRHGPQASLPLLRSSGAFPQVGDRGEYVLDFLKKLEGSLLPKPLVHESSQGSTLEYVIQGWLNEISPNVKFTFDINSKTDSSHAEIDGFRTANVGFGLSYTLPVLAAILGMAATPPSNGLADHWWSGLGEKWEERKKEDGILVILENPEAHLHPQGQTSMGKLIALAVSCGVQIVVETHSDHLMDGIRIAVKEGLLGAENVAFQYFTKDSNGVSKISSPQLHDNGKLDFWPEGFFDQALKNRAILARRGTRK